MSILEAIVLGITQGLTEFLPISSSGHLVIVPALLGWDQPPLAFDLILHAGTLLAVIATYWTDLVTLARQATSSDNRAARRMIGFLIVGTIPAAAVGLALGNQFEDLFTRPGISAGTLLITAIWLVVSEKLGERMEAKRNVDYTRSAAIGFAQAVSIVPGISRSGSTIGTGIALGISREDAARFSFLLAIPAIAGAMLTRVPDIVNGEFDITGSVIVGFIVSALSGFLAIRWLLRVLRTHSMIPFAVYLVIAVPIVTAVLAVIN